MNRSATKKNERVWRWPLGRSANGPSSDRRVALRIEDDRLMLCIASHSAEALQLNEPADEMIVDQIRCSDSSGWINSGRWTEMVEALTTLKQRHQIGDDPVAISLSGDFCVTRISVGAVEDVDRDLSALAGRIPRYLQLGPGGKVTGHTRETIGPGMEHALTAVGNRVRLKNLYEVFRMCDVEIAWLEPSLVSLARLTGWLGLDRHAPVLIADSFGQSWEVGISFEGRLLLDYRPAAARDGNEFADVIDHHLERLQRFCQRHRGMSDHQLDQLFVGGGVDKVDPVVRHFANNSKLSVSAIDLSSAAWKIDRYKNVSDDDSDVIACDVPLATSDTVAVMAAVLPLITNHEMPKPDLLQEIRRDRGKSFVRRMTGTYWPVAAAAVLLLFGFAMVANERSRADRQQQKREFVETQMRQTQVRMAGVHEMREIVTHLQTIESKTFSPHVNQLVTQMAQCLPAQTRLRSMVLDSDRQIHLEGWTAQENDIYDVISYVRRVPEIDQVALLGTNASADDDGLIFQIRLGIRPDRSAMDLGQGASHE
ncbi:hypothetical protein [Rhodopirellula sp. P2]|uniref:hypothetical protein n=1 Tax=Rhodopirellula sp. P2 TaxID=2127060 RepID=UPI002367A8C4|nr:hypothetical protein [Rhodopirellula sp. P2]WDQ16427.1 hypothetical protein PSR62_22795 [Rhodopirellula sp. P2]